MFALQGFSGSSTVLTRSGGPRSSVGHPEVYAITVWDMHNPAAKRKQDCNHLDRPLCGERWRNEFQGRHA
jgi:hypothetical protein